MPHGINKKTGVLSTDKFPERFINFSLIVSTETPTLNQDTELLLVDQIIL